MTGDRDSVAATGSRWSGVPFALPWLVGLVGLTLGPMAVSLGLSFTQWDGLSLRDGVTWVGTRHYRDMLAGDPQFRRALSNSLFYTLAAVPLGVGCSLGMALLLNTTAQSCFPCRSVFASRRCRVFVAFPGWSCDGWSWRRRCGVGCS